MPEARWIEKGKRVKEVDEFGELAPDDSKMQNGFVFPKIISVDRCTRNEREEGGLSVDEALEIDGSSSETFVVLSYAWTFLDRVCLYIVRIYYSYTQSKNINLRTDVKDKAQATILHILRLCTENYKAHTQ